MVFSLGPAGPNWFKVEILRVQNRFPSVKIGIDDLPTYYMGVS